MPRQLPSSWSRASPKTSDDSNAAHEEGRRSASKIPSTRGRPRGSKQEPPPRPQGRRAKAPANTPTEGWMVDGYDRDDRYRMVEDELLHIAGLFTAHVHAAEYERLRAQARQRNAHTVDSMDTIASKVKSVDVERGASTKPSVERVAAELSRPSEQSTAVGRARVEATRHDRRDLPTSPNYKNRQDSQDGQRRWKPCLSRQDSLDKDILEPQGVPSDSDSDEQDSLSVLQSLIVRKQTPLVVPTGRQGATGDRQHGSSKEASQAREHQVKDSGFGLESVEGSTPGSRSLSNDLKMAAVDRSMRKTEDTRRKKRRVPFDDSSEDEALPGDTNEESEVSVATTERTGPLGHTSGLTLGRTPGLTSGIPSMRSLKTTAPSKQPPVPVLPMNSPRDSGSRLPETGRSPKKACLSWTGRKALSSPTKRPVSETSHVDDQRREVRGHRTDAPVHGESDQKAEGHAGNHHHAKSALDPPHCTTGGVGRDDSSDSDDPFSVIRRRRATRPGWLTRTASSVLPSSVDLSPRRTDQHVGRRTDRHTTLASTTSLNLAPSTPLPTTLTHPTHPTTSADAVTLARSSPRKRKAGVIPTFL